MLGPKEILSRAIANLLSEYFVIDDPYARIESQLCGDAEIVLSNVELKKCTIEVTESTVATLTGTVAHISFQWNWGRDATLERSSDWVRNAKLVIGGVQFLASLERNSGERNEQGPSTTAATTIMAASIGKSVTGGMMTYVNDQIQRIMDTINVSVRDFGLRVQFPNENTTQQRSLVMGGSGLSIQSFGRIEGKPLKQELTISNMVWYFLSPDGLTHPLLAPGISYKSTIVRAVGYDDFLLSGITQGYRVLGECMEDVNGIDEGCVFHVGETQIEYIQDLMALLTTSEPNCDADVDVPPGTFKNESSNIQPTGTLQSTLEASFFQLPLSAVSIMLPNETKISLSGLVVKYRMDGSLLVVEGRSGILVNDFQFLSLGETCIWQLDAIRKFLIVADIAATRFHEHDELVAFIHSRPFEIENVQEGIAQVIQMYQNAQMKHVDDDVAAAAEVDNDTSTEEAIAEVGWTFCLQGVLGILWEGEDGEANGECTIRGITANSELMSIDIIAIESLFVPGVVKLKEPIMNAEVTFDGTIMHLLLGAVVAVLDEDPEDESDLQKLARSVPGPSEYFMSSRMNIEPFEQTAPPVFFAPDEATPGFIMPFGLKVVCEKVALLKPHSNKTVASFSFVQIALGPDDTTTDVGRPAIRAALAIQEIQHYLVGALEVKLTGLVYTDDFSTIHNYNFASKSISLAAGYSAFDWQRLFEAAGGRSRQQKQAKRTSKEELSKEEPKPFKLPYAHIDKLKIKVIVTSDLVGVESSTLHIGAFDGKNGTTMHDIVNLYIARVLTKVPSLITNVDVLGVNLTDGSSSFMGLLLGGALLGGLGWISLPFGSILGVATVDGVKNTMKAGKRSRGAEVDDKTKVFDFLRGAKHMATEASRSGAEKRGKTRDQIRDPLDWAVGAISNVSTYTKRHKKRLGAAAAGTVGLGIGITVCGPIGGVVGGLVAWALAKKTIPETEKASQMRRSPPADMVTESFEQTLQRDNARRNMQDTGPTHSERSSKASTPVLQGLLWKRQDFFKWDWKAHFFTLGDGEIRCYRTAESPPHGTQNKLNHDISPIKSIKLNNTRIQPDNQLSNLADDLFVFTINSKHQKVPLWVLAAGSKEERQQWVDTLDESSSDEEPASVRHYHPFQPGLLTSSN